MGHSVDSQVFQPLGHHQRTNNEREQVARRHPQPQRPEDMNEKEGSKSKDSMFAIMYERQTQSLLKY